MKPGREVGPFFVIVLVITMLVVIARLFTPTTKEYAAIKIIPAIVNNETITEESKEIYDLAKQWLKEASKDRSNAKENDKE